MSLYCFLSNSILSKEYIERTTYVTGRHEVYSENIIYALWIFNYFYNYEINYPPNQANAEKFEEWLKSEFKKFASEKRQFY